MSNRLQSQTKEPGMPPGSLVFTAEEISASVDIGIINFNELEFEEQHGVAVADCKGLNEQRTTTWVNVNGVHDVDVIEELGTLVGLHPLIMEDLVNLDQRPKIEDFEEYLFIVMKMLHYDRDNNLEVEHVSLVIGKTFVISFQEYAGDVFEPIRQRLRTSKGRIRKKGADFLAYALIDTVVDHYFSVIEEIGELIDTIEEQLLTDTDKTILLRINRLKREVILLRKSIWPLREVISGLLRSESTIFEDKTLIFLRDVYDHTIQVAEMVETFRDLLSSLTDLYMSSLSQKMNEVMQFLTIVGTIFIPLSFLTGVYGMNFDNMPELHWTLGYPLLMVLMMIVSGMLLLYFRRKKWL